MAYRKEKLEEQIRRVVSDLIIKEIKDPRVGFVSITSVALNRDFSEAKVGVSVLGGPRDIRKAWEGIQSAAGFIQFKLAKNLSVRHSPKIEFFLDSSVADGVRMVNLLDELESQEETHHEEQADGGGDKQE